MKKLYTFIIVFISVLGLAMLSNSCTDLPDLIEELDLANVLTPTSTSASISNADGRTTTFSWSSSSTATQYTLEIYRWPLESEPDEVTDANLSSGELWDSPTVEQSSSSTTSYVVQLEVDYGYYARVKAQNPGNQGDSNWATFRYPLEPYLVMDPIEEYEITEKTSTTISLKWVIPDGDTDGINQIRVSPNPDNENSEYKAYSVSSGATEFTVDGLKPSTLYTLKANFGTATRGTLVAYTRFDANEGAITVGDSLDFVNAFLEWPYDENPSLEIHVEYKDGEVYDIPTIPVLGELTIIGLETASGDKPVIRSNVSLYPKGSTYTLKDADGNTVAEIANVPGATKLRMEGLKFDGNSYGTNNAVTAGAEFQGAGNSSVDVNMVNCDFEGYKCGIFYDNSYHVPYNAITMEGLYVEDTYGDGGDFIDIRCSSATSLTIKNNTFTDGCRTFIRFDSDSGNNTVGTVTISNNTINNVCTFNNSNNRGLFRFRCDVTGEYELSNNLFLNNNAVDDYTVLIYSESDVKAPTRVSNNWFYNNNEVFLQDVKRGDEIIFTESQALANGGQLLTEDPCYDSSRGNFYLSSQDASEAGVGDPRWCGDYIAQPDPDLEVVEYGHTWNLTDTKTFYSTIDQTCTRGNTRFIINNTPITVGDDGFTFTGAASLMSSNNVPNDCAMAFIVNGPGSVVISTADAPSAALNVGYGVYNASTISTSQITVVGSVSGGASKTQVALGDLSDSGETIYIIYIYPIGGAITMNQLVWSEDISAGGANLATPSNFVLSAESAASTETVTLSWDAVANAGSYVVNTVGYNGVDTETTVTSNSYSFSGLEAGFYNFYVKAVPADSDTVREESAWGGEEEDDEALFFSEGKALTNVSAYSDTSWGSTTFEYVYYAMTNGEGGNFTQDFVYDNLHFTGGNTSSVLNDAVNYAGETVYAYSFGGSGSATSRSMIFNVPGNGTLNMEIESGSGSGDSRWMKVFVDGEEYTTGENYGTSEETEATGAGYEAPVKGKPRQHKITITGAHSGSEIMIYSASSGIIVLSLGWTPEPVEGEGIIPDDETITEEYITDYSNEGTAAGYADVADGETLTVNKITYAGAITWDSSRYKMNGASKVGDDGIPTSRYACFKIATTGKITHKMISGSSSDAERKYDVILVKGGEVTTLYSEYAPTSSGADAVVTEVTAEHLAGATEPVYIYVYVEANCNLYQIGFTPDTN